MAIFLGGRAFPPGTDMSRLMRPGTRGPLAGWREDAEARGQKAVEEVVDTGLDVGKQVVGDKVSEALGTGKGGSGGVARTGEDLGRGNVAVGDRVQTAIGTLTVKTVQTLPSEDYPATKYIVVTFPQAQSVLFTVEKRVRSNGAIFYKNIYVIVPAGTPGSKTYKEAILKQTANWANAPKSVGYPANTTILLVPIPGSAPQKLIKVFGGDVDGVLLRSDAQDPSFAMEGTREQAMAARAADQAESAAASASAKAGGKVAEDAALALALSLVQSTGAVRFSDIPSILRRMTSESMVNVLFGGRRPSASYDPGPPPQTPNWGPSDGNGTTAGGWGVGTWVGIVAVGVAAVVGVAVLARKRRAPALSAYYY